MTASTLTVRPTEGLRRTGRRFGLLLAALIPLAAFGVFFFYPVISLVVHGFVGGYGWDTGSIGEVLGRARFRRIIGFTIYQAAASAGLALLLGVPGAYLLYRCTFRGRALLRALVTVPFVLPSVVVGLAFRALFATNGLLGSWGWDGSLAAILAAHVFLNYAVVVRTVGVSWAHLDPRPAQAAASLGASPPRVFLTVTLRMLAPALAGAFVMVFLFCATSFGVILIMGGAKYSTLETEIYYQTAQQLNLRTAAILSILQIILVTAVLALSAWLRRRGEATLRLRAAADSTRPLRLRDLPAVGVTLVAAALVVLPLGVMVARSLQTDDGWGWGNYRALAAPPTDNAVLVPVTSALGNSLRAAVIATAISLAVGVLLSVVLARRPRRAAARRAADTLDTLVMLPLGVSAVTVGFGFLITLNAPPINLRSAAVLVPVAQAMVATPLVVRTVLPTLRAADDRLRQAASVLGAGPLRVWTSVDLPLMSRALAGAAAFAFAVSLGEFGATSFLARPQSPTLPVMIGKLVSRPGTENLGMALAAATVLALACGLAVLLTDLAVGGARNSPGIGGF